jgi:hypothetical protein
MRYILSVIMVILLSSCMDIGTTTSYNSSFTSSSSESNKIPISFSGANKGSVYYFILASSNNDGNPHDLLKVRWINKDKSRKQFDGMKSVLKFIINKENIITLVPMKEPVLAGYNINDGTREEEGIYMISRDQIKEIAYAKTVEVELIGKNKIVVGKFNRWHSFRGFKSFLKDS